MLTIRELAEGQRQAWPPEIRRKAACLPEMRYYDFPELVSGKVYEVAAIPDRLGRDTDYVVFRSPTDYTVVPKKEFDGGFQFVDSENSMTESTAS